VRELTERPDDAPYKRIPAETQNILIYIYTRYTCTENNKTFTETVFTCRTQRYRKGKDGPLPQSKILVRNNDSLCIPLYTSPHSRTRKAFYRFYRRGNAQGEMLVADNWAFSYCLYRLVRRVEKRSKHLRRAHETSS